MTAKVELKEGVTYGPGPDGRSWQKGIPQFLVDSKAIQDYKSNSRFSVAELESAGKVKAALVEPVADEIPEKAPEAEDDENAEGFKSEDGEKEVKTIPKKDKKPSSKRKRKG